MRDIGKNIRDIREQKKWTQEDLANQLFVSRQTVSNYETGRTKPDIEMLIKIASVLHTDIHDLIYGSVSLLERRRKRTILWVSSICTFVMIILSGPISNIAEQLKSLEYNSLPKLLLNIYYKPTMYALIGFTLLQYLDRYLKLRSCNEATSKVINWGITASVLLYLIVTAPLVLSLVMRWKAPDTLITMALFVIGGLSTNGNQIAYLLIASLIGSLIWFANMNRIGQKRNS